MIKTIRDQRGIAMILELLLLAIVLAAMGVVVWHAYHRSGSGTATTATPATTASTTPNGNVNNAVNALTQSATTESSAGVNENDSASTGGADTAAQNIGGSYNENSF